jgi:hypothetical protein
MRRSRITQKGDQAHLNDCGMNRFGDGEQEEIREGQMSELQPSALMPMQGLRNLR